MTMFLQKQATDEEEVARALEEAAHLRAELEVVSQARDEARAQLARFRAESSAPLERITLLTGELQAAKAASLEQTEQLDRLTAALAAANSKARLFSSSVVFRLLSLGPSYRQ